jgi:hypothetical protein
MSRRSLALLVTLIGLSSAALADDPPVVEHQPVPCTIPDVAIAICAPVSDDAMVTSARVYFRSAGEDYYSYVEMAFTGLQYCGTLPAPRQGKIDAIEYYIMAVDDAFQTQRTSTFQMQVQSQELCGFPPVERDPAKAAAITVHATHKKQGGKLDDDFVREGVSFVPRN